MAIIFLQHIEKKPTRTPDTMGIKGKFHYIYRHGSKPLVIQRKDICTLRKFEQNFSACSWICLHIMYVWVWVCAQYMHRRVGHNVPIKKSSAKLAKSREKIDFMLNELEFIHLSISLYTLMLNYTARVSLRWQNEPALYCRWEYIESIKGENQKPLKDTETETEEKRESRKEGKAKETRI